MQRERLSIIDLIFTRGVSSRFWLAPSSRLDVYTMIAANFTNRFMTANETQDQRLRMLSEFAALPWLGPFGSKLFDDLIHVDAYSKRTWSKRYYVVDRGDPIDLGLKTFQERCVPMQSKVGKLSKERLQIPRTSVRLR